MSRSKKSQLSVVIALAFTLAGCKTSQSSAPRQESGNQTPVVTQFDLNDVSILVKRPRSSESKEGYLRLTSTTSEGPLLTNAMYDDLVAMLPNPHPVKYEDWAVSGIRIDDCARVLAALPCQAQIRLVLQPLPQHLGFGDQAVHIGFNIDESQKVAMFQEFLDLKKSALPLSTNGPLGENPVLKNEGMTGPYATRMNSLVLKYALLSKIDRVSIMTSVQKREGGSTVGDWNFAASMPVKDQKIIPSPIPCQSDKVNTFATSAATFLLPGSNQRIQPSMNGCPEFDVTKLIVKKVEQADERELADKAIRINNPELTFFGSTTCVTCHLASRRLDQKMGTGFSTKEDGNPLRFVPPGDVSKTIEASSERDNAKLWGIRAFGWGELGDVPGITVYTLNDTMRVAHALNEMIRTDVLH